MLSPGLAKKVTIHLNEDTSAGHDFLYNEIFAFLRERGVAGHFDSARGRFRVRITGPIRPRATRRSKEHLPVRIEFIESRNIADALLPSLCELITDGLIEAHDTTVIKAAAREEPA